MINIYHLKFFIDAVRTGKLSESARLNYVTQSTVSQAIKSLENHLDTRLLIHKKKNFELTETGRAIVENAETIFDSIENLKNTVEESRGSYAGELKISASGSIISSFLNPYIKKIRRQYPKIRIVIKIGNSEVSEHWLKNGEVDLVFVLDDGKTNIHFDRHVIKKGVYVIASDKTCKLKISEMGAIITRQARSEVNYFLNELTKKFGKTPQISMEIISWETMKTFIMNSNDFGILPDYVAKSEKKIIPRKFEFPNYPYELIALKLKKRTLTKNSKLLLDMLQGKSD